ncbi:MAG: hypothetical protein PHE25_01660 [Candidatus Gracilibacteria bacterium]|nr:hypothetical protein [Candidatus Gracilibacteria bacterium]
MGKQSFKIENNIYNEDIILQAMKDFSEITEISYKNGELTIKSDEDINEIFNEFMNYYLALSNELA